jgi:hypothetical protein
VDVELAAIIQQLKRKAHVLIYDGKRMGFFHDKQQGEEMLALLEMLERALERRRNETNSKIKSTHSNGTAI